MECVFPNIPAHPLTTENKEKLLEERRRFNIKSFKVINLIYALFTPGFILQTIFFPKNGVHDEFTAIYIAIFSALCLSNLLFFLFFHVTERRWKNKRRYAFLRLFLMLLFTMSMGLNYLDLHYGQELSLFILNLMFLCSFSWFSCREYLVLSCYNLFLLTLIYGKLIIFDQLPHSDSLPALVYFFIALAVYRNLAAIRTENFLNRTSLEEQYRLRAAESVTDPLTGLLNRRYMEDDMNKERHRSLRLGTTFCLLMIDIDHFKLINDNYGHVAGDGVLKELSLLLKKSLREYDKIYRYGGEEFLVFLPETKGNDARNLGERIRTEIASHPFPTVKQKVTVSMGIAQSHRESSVDELIKETDRMLYRAKENGRNQVAFSRAEG
ncbi:MAG: GGDEF domain-containing protein [Spirochaetales bacterium]|nr:GGDEF domain-containing protein [Spirochaetales bacterium]